ncbi:MAG TPA: hypothetical protein VN740_04455 [Solirubrobacteraceae bacterium]|nr:hypothetical protein [Solirubrobacteraceae bacterium]
MLAVALASAPAALAASDTPSESYATLLTQIAAKKGSPDRVVRATVDKAKHHVRVTLANGSRPLVSYPATADKQLVDNLLHHHIPVVYAKKPAVHHTLRYVAAGVVAVLLLIGGGVWFYTRGRQEPPTDSDTPAATSV